MESKPVKFREWSLWIIGILAFSGVSLSTVRQWFALAIPALGWLVGTISVPWLGLIVAGMLIGAAGYAFGSHGKGLPVQPATPEDPQHVDIDWLTPPPSPPAFEPNEVEVIILQALRWFDRAVARSEIVEHIEEPHPGTSMNEMDLGLRQLHRKGWIAGGQVFHPRGRQMAYQLSEPGMDFSKAQGFPHSAQNT